MKLRSSCKAFGIHSFFCLVIALVVTSSVSNNAVAQLQKAPSPGDIVKYEDIHDGLTYGLVIELSRASMVLEKIGRRGKLDKRTVPFTTVWEFVDKVNKKAEKKLRKWKSQDGKFEIEASFVAIEDDKVRLKKANGKTIAVPLSKLSKRDQETAEAKARGEGVDNPFAVEEADDLPEGVRILVERRNELMVDQKRHNFLAKRNPNLMVGDIIKYEQFPEGVAFGIVIGLNAFNGTVETVGRSGDLKSERMTGHARWWFYDRTVAPLKLRTWSSANKKFKIKARLVGMESGNKVVLEKEDGKSLTVPLSKLRESDATYAARYRSRFSGKQDEALAAQREEYGEDLQILLARRLDLIDQFVANNVAARDVAKMKSISLNTRAINVSSEQLKPVSLNDNPFSLAFSVPAGLHPQVDRVCYSPQSGHVALIVYSPFSGDPTLVVTNIESDTVITNENSEQIGDEGEVLSMSPSGRRILVYSENSMRNQQLELWSHEDETLKQVSVVPYDSFWSPRAHLFSDDSGFVINDKGDLVFFDLEDRIKPTHIVHGGRLHGRSRVQVTDDGKHVFYFGPGSASLHVIDVESKKCVGGLALGKNASQSSANVNADGKTATRVERERLTVYDLATGKPVAQHDLPMSVGVSSTFTDRFPLLGPTLVETLHGTIYDLELEVEIGSIARGGAHGTQNFSNSTRIKGEVDFTRSSARGGFGGMMVGARGGRHFQRDRESKKPALVNVDYERLDVEEIEAFAKTLSVDDIIEFGPGDSLQLDFDIGDSSVERQLEDLIDEVMEEGDIRVVRKSDFVLTFKYSEGRSQTERYNIVGGAKPRTRNVTLTPKTCSAKLSYQGQVIWSRSQSASLKGVWSEDRLNEIVKTARSLSARKLLDFRYPNELRVLSPDLKRKFEWR